jgi:5-formyltetrahydrofolate cyclo-ligase
MLAKRDAMASAEKEKYDAEIGARIEEVINERGAKTVHIYLPMGSEINIFPHIEKMLAAGITVVNPKALNQRKLQHLVLHSLGELESGIYGTQHPAGGNEYSGNIDLFVIPGLAFDRDNNRLGYGAGYYDAFLVSQPDAYKLGICYPFQVVDSVPLEAHDVQLDKVIW